MPSNIPRLILAAELTLAAAAKACSHSSALDSLCRDARARDCRNSRSWHSRIAVTLAKRPLPAGRRASARSYERPTTSPGTGCHSAAAINLRFTYVSSLSVSEEACEERRLTHAHCYSWRAGYVRQPGSSQTVKHGVSSCHSILGNLI